LRYRKLLEDHPGKKPTGQQLKIPLVLHNAAASALVNKLHAGINRRARHPDNNTAAANANAKKMIDAIAEIYGIDPDDPGWCPGEGDQGIQIS